MRVASSEGRKVEPGKAERADADLWNLFDGSRIEEECEMTSKRSRESCLSDAGCSLIDSTATWGVPVLTPDASGRKGDDGDDNKIQCDICLSVIS